MGNIAARFRVSFAVAVLLAVSSAATAADYPRRIAIAPFTILGPHEDIRQTVDIIPRLISSRLMAMTGAEVLVIPPGQGSAEDAAKRAGLPLLLKGSVAKLGAGYSIDVTVTDLTTGQMADAFFAAAATEDQIILRLGDLAADISEMLFGVKVARAYAPPPGSYPAAAPPPASAPPAPSGAAATTQTAAQPEPVPAPAPAAPDTLRSGWVPSSFTKVAQTPKIPDEIYGVVAGDIDSEGNGEVIAYGKQTIYIYRVKGEEILPYTRVTKTIHDHILSIDTVDLDGDGRKEILVTNVASAGGEGSQVADESLDSFVLKRKGDVYEEVAREIPYFLVVLSDWMGKPVVVGQREGMDVPFQGKFVPLSWDGKGFIAGEPFPQDTNILPLSEGLPGLSAARFDKEWRLIYTDATSRLRIVDSDGKSQYSSRDLYGSGLDSFKWGPYDPIEQTRKQFQVRKAVRVAPGATEFPLVLIPEVKKGMLDIVQGFYDSTRVVLLKWEGGDFLEKAGTKSTGHFISGADFLSPSGLKRGDMIVVSEIEQIGSIFKSKISRLYLYRLE
jgi:hypothetical protein